MHITLRPAVLLQRIFFYQKNLKPLTDRIDQTGIIVIIIVCQYEKLTIQIYRKFTSKNWKKKTKKKKKKKNQIKKQQQQKTWFLARMSQMLRGSS